MRKIIKYEYKETDQRCELTHLTVTTYITYKL